MRTINTQEPSYLLLHGYAHSERLLGDFESDRYLKRDARQFILERMDKRIPSFFEQKNKWIGDQKSLQLGDFVLMVDEHIPGKNQWEICSIVATFPGVDQQLRVVDVKTTKSAYRRPVTKLCRTPVEGDVEDNEES